MEDLKIAGKLRFKDDYEKFVKEANDKGESIEKYYLTKTGRTVPKCNNCSRLLPGFHFCCSECEFKDDCYNLCVKCYYDRKFKHRHDSIVDNHSILTKVKKKLNEKRTENSKLVKKIQELEKGKDKRDLPIVTRQAHTRSPAETKMSKREIMDKESMKKLANIANLHYNAAPPRIKNSVDDDFFKSMVKQKGNSSVTLNDFLESMNEQKHSKYANKELFQMLVKDRKKGMSMSECRNLYYILMSGRPFCSNCGHFIPDIYICCNKCSASSYTLCLHCYSDKEVYTKHKHYGKDDAYFYDCTVLHPIFKTSPATPNQESGSSNAIVKWDRSKTEIQWDKFNKMANLALKVSLIFTAISGACTIM